METWREISDVVDRVLGLLKDEAKLFRGAEAEAESLKLDLQILQATLNDLFELRLAFVTVVLKALAELWSRVIFMLDRCLNNLEQRRPRTNDSQFYQIRAIQGRMARLHSRMQESGSTSTVGFFEEDELVGIQSQKEELVRELITPSRERSVISLVGFCGVGQTTLASVVYQSEAVRKHFGCHAWINVSQPYYMKELLSRVTKMICPNEDSVDGEMNMMPGRFNPLFRFLSEKRYVIVFDGVRHPDIFHFINDFLPETSKGGKIIITTNDNGIAASCDIVQTLQPLPEPIALDLFYKSMFMNSYGLISKFYPGSDLRGAVP